MQCIDQIGQTLFLSAAQKVLSHRKKTDKREPPEQKNCLEFAIYDPSLIYSWILQQRQCTAETRLSG